MPADRGHRRREDADLAIPDTRLSLVGIAYTLTFGSLLIVAGRAGDLFGRRRLLLIGLTLFSVASLVTGMATSQWTLFFGRAAQGVGAAMVSPTAMALLIQTFAEGRRLPLRFSVGRGSHGADRHRGDDHPAKHRNRAGYEIGTC